MEVNEKTLHAAVFKALDEGMIFIGKDERGIPRFVLHPMRAQHGINDLAAFIIRVIKAYQ